MVDNDNEKLGSHSEDCCIVLVFHAISKLESPKVAVTNIKSVRLKSEFQKTALSSG